MAKPKELKPLTPDRASILAHLSDLAENSPKDNIRVAALAEMARIEGLSKGVEREAGVGSVMLVPFVETKEEWSRLCQSHNKALMEEIKETPITPPTP